MRKYVDGIYSAMTAEEVLEYNTSINTISLDDVKKERIEESEIALATFLEANPLYYNNALYTCTFSKQLQMQLQYSTYLIEKTTNPDAVLTWNTHNDICSVITEDAFIELMLAIKAYVYPLVDYQRSISKQISECTKVAEVNAM